MSIFCIVPNKVHTCGSSLLIMKAMNATIIGNKNRYMMSKSTGGKNAPMTVAAAINMIMVITGPKIATNMYIMVNELSFCE